MHGIFLQLLFTCHNTFSNVSGTPDFDGKGGADAIHMPAAAIIVERTHDSLPPQSRPGVSQHAKNVAPHGHAHSGSKSSIFTMKN